MTVLSAGRQTARKETGLKSYKVAASATIYQGGGVCINTDGYAVPAADSAGFKSVGIAEEGVDNSSGGAGDLSVLVQEGLFLLIATSITQAMVGEVMYWADDQTFDDASTNMVVAGILEEYVSATSGWVRIEPLVSLNDKVERRVITVTDDYTVLEEDSGSIFILATDNKEFTLPATKIGLEYTFINMGADGNVLLNIDPADGDGIYGTIAAIQMSGTDGGILSSTKSTMLQGDWAKIVGNGSTGWIIVGGDGVWAGA